MVKVKICGITKLEDALRAVEYGADALGFIFSDSQRQIKPEKAKYIINNLPPWIAAVGVFVDESVDKVRDIHQTVGLDWIQLHGSESADYCHKLGCKIIKAFRVRGEDTLEDISLYPVAGILLDAYDKSMHGGTGKRFNWDIAVKAKEYKKPVILAGGLNPENIEEAIIKVDPYGVEGNSGVEKAPGIKDHSKLEDFIIKVKRMA